MQQLRHFFYLIRPAQLQVALFRLSLQLLFGFELLLQLPDTLFLLSPRHLLASWLLLRLPDVHVRHFPPQFSDFPQPLQSSIFPLTTKLPGEDAQLLRLRDVHVLQQLLLLNAVVRLARPVLFHVRLTQQRQQQLQLQLQLLVFKPLMFM